MLQIKIYVWFYLHLYFCPLVIRLTKCMFIPGVNEATEILDSSQSAVPNQWYLALLVLMWTSS